MEKHKAIPKGYMTVGELAKKMGVTVRTLQYYDKEGFFSPSAESEGGRRLYSDKDLVELHTILSLKHLGFSLEDIKNKVISLDTPESVATVLTQQADDIKIKIQNLSKAYENIQLLKSEVLQIKSVDFKKYADIITNLQMKNHYYWIIKHFDEQMLDHIRNRFDVKNSITFINDLNILVEKIFKLKKDNVPPDSDKAQLLAKDFWNMIIEFTNGDMSMLPNLIKISNIKNSTTDYFEKQAVINDYLEKAFDIYFTKLGVNPFPEE